MSKLNIVKNREGNRLAAELEGRVDATTAPQLDKEISAELEGIKELVIDLKKVEYMSSVGLRVILGFQKTMTEKFGTLTICSPADNIYDIFAATGFIEFLRIER